MEPARRLHTRRHGDVFSPQRSVVDDRLGPVRLGFVLREHFGELPVRPVRRDPFRRFSWHRRPREHLALSLGVHAAARNRNAGERRQHYTRETSWYAHRSSFRERYLITAVVRIADACRLDGGARRRFGRSLSASW